jgi:hypothetical protein
MSMTYNYSLKLNLTGFSGKPFKVLTDLVRSAVKQEHGYNATKGLTDRRLQAWPIMIRFRRRQNRDSFETVLKDTLSPRVLRKMSIEHFRPRDKNVGPVRIMNI